jgi:hypothetical protein
MDGTRATPGHYTGRLGIPPFQEVSRILVLRIPTRHGASSHAELVDDATGLRCFLRLSAGRWSCPDGFPRERSEMSPQWLMTACGGACGRLEDTRRAKRLIADDGTEMRSAHLSCFAFEGSAAGGELLKQALDLAARRGLPALFVSVAPQEAPALGPALEHSAIVTAPATVFGTGIETTSPWNINTAEI